MQTTLLRPLCFGQILDGARFGRRERIESLGLKPAAGRLHPVFAEP